MLHNLSVLLSYIYLFTFICIIPLYAENEIEDSIDIFQSKNSVIALVEGNKTVPFELRPKEKIMMKESKGYIGVIVTNLNFYVISTTSPLWHSLPLTLNNTK